MKIGDKVVINKTIVIKFTGGIPNWYTTDIYTICNISKSEKTITLDKTLTGYSNLIDKTYLMSLKQLRKQKLDKLNQTR